MEHCMTRRLSIALLACAAWLGLLAPASAQSANTLRFVVPYPPAAAPIA
jgi:hypothetical protein